MNNLTWKIYLYSSIFSIPIRFLRSKFDQADKNGSGEISLDECASLIDELNIKLPKGELERLFSDANKDKDLKNLNETEFVNFFYNFCKIPELEELFIKYITPSSSSDSKAARMTVNELYQFLVTEQRMELSLEELSKCIEAFEPNVDKTTFSNEGFIQFMTFSDLNNIVDISRQRLVDQDMTQPLSHYWIASSHNTYVACVCLCTIVHTFVVNFWTIIFFFSFT